MIAKKNGKSNDSEWRLALNGIPNKNILLWGAGAITVLIVLALGVAIYINFSNYIANERLIFSAQHALLQEEVELKQASVRRGVSHAEMLWEVERGHAKSHKDFQKFLDQNGRLYIHDDPRLLSVLAIGDLSKNNIKALDDYVFFSSRLAGIASGDIRPLQSQLQSYYYSPDENYLAFMPAPTHDVKAIEASSMKHLMQRFAVDLGDLNDAAVRQAWKQSQAVRWIPPRQAPAYGQAIMQLVQPAFDGDEVFLVYVSNLPTRQLAARWRPSEFDGAFFIVSDDAQVLLQSEGLQTTKAQAAAMAQEMLEQTRWRWPTPWLEGAYQDGLFTISQPLGDTGWFVVYAYSIHTMIQSLKPSLIWYGAGACVVLVLLWAGVLVFHYRVFLPAFRNSLRVHEIEQLSSRIMRMAQVGLGLVDKQSGEVLLGNQAMVRYSIADMPLGAYLATSYREADPAFSADLTREITAQRVDGEQVELFVQMSPWFTQSHAALLCSILDITSLKAVERALQEARSAAEQANQSKSLFLAAVSHELRTPLNAILGNLELLEREELSSRVRDRVSIASTASQTLMRIIDDILDLSKVEAGQLSLEIQPLDLVKEVESVVRVFLPRAESKEVALYYRITPGIVACVGDALRLRQILSNLLSNAIKFTHEGEIAVTVESVQIEAQDVLRFTVRDSGIGMTLEQQSRLFIPFSQADAAIARQYGGTGLGLALCQRLAALMGGSISVESHLGQGSAFTLELPWRHRLAPSLDIACGWQEKQVGVWCANPLWRDAMQPHWVFWGAQVVPVEMTLESLQGLDVLVLLGNPRTWSVTLEDAAVQCMPVVVDVQECGPLMPLRDNTVVRVSCYSLEGMQQALSRAVGDTHGQAQATECTEDAPTQCLRILVAEDNPANRLLLQDQLDVLDHYVVMADSGGRALELFYAQEFDIVITDLDMPGMNGYALARALRSQGVDLPIWALTAHAGESERARCKEAGIDEVLLKPLSVKVLATMLATLPNNQSTVVDASMQEAYSSWAQLAPTLQQAVIDAYWMYMQRIEQAVNDGDVAVVRSGLHAIKGSFAMLQEQALVQQIASLEQMADSATASDMLLALQNLDDAVQAKIEST